MPEAPEIAGFHHTALLYASDDEYLAGTVPFLRAGLETGDAAYVVVGADRLELLRSALGPDAAEVRFDDMADVGCNPARIIPAWQDFVDEHPGRGLRGIGEPIFAARPPAEVVECERHEALLNLAFARTPSFTLLCPYDTVALDPAVVEHASCTHPHVRAAGAEHASGAYGGDTAAQAPFATPLQAPGAPASALAFDGMMLAGVRRMVG